MKSFAILAGGLALIGVLTTPASAQSLKKYHDKTLFLADTAAATVFGPVPNVGMFIRPGDWPTELGG